MIKYLKVICLVIILLIPVTVLYGKFKLPSTTLTKETFMNMTYYMKSSESYLGAYPKINIVLKKNKEINTLEDLENNSDYILKVKITEDYIATGNGILNTCSVIKTYKGSIHKGESLNIYDLSDFWMYGSVSYPNGFTPLKPNETYIIFIQNAPRPNIDKTYVYSTMDYGHFRYGTKPTVLTQYDTDNSMIKIKDAMNYDYISLEDDQYVATYKKISQEINIKYQ